jgi:hypothetical protein
MMFEVWIDGEAPVEMTTEALRAAWRDSLPQALARALSLDIGVVATLNVDPEILVRRLSWSYAIDLRSQLPDALFR